MEIKETEIDEVEFQYFEDFEIEESDDPIEPLGMLDFISEFKDEMKRSTDSRIDIEITSANSILKKITFDTYGEFETGNVWAYYDTLDNKLKLIGANDYEFDKSELQLILKFM